MLEIFEKGKRLEFLQHRCNTTHIPHCSSSVCQTVQKWVYTVKKIKLFISSLWRTLSVTTYTRLNLYQLLLDTPQLIFTVWLRGINSGCFNDFWIFRIPFFSASTALSKHNLINTLILQLYAHLQDRSSTLMLLIGCVKYNLTIAI